MGIISAITGNAGEIAPGDAAQALGPVLLAGEMVERAYHVGRDMFAFTNRRLVLVDRQGLTGSKVEYRSIPYRTITNFSVETTGSFDLDAEMKIYLTGNPVPIQKEFNRKVNVFEVQAVLATKLLY